jgi:prepilin-type processing-associated H-X9-DG protein
LGYGVPPPKSSGKKVLLIVLVCLLAAAVPFCACMVSILLPSLNRAREQANRVKCASNLRLIGQGVMMYANENRGQFPDTMERILTTQDLTNVVFCCPSSSDSPAPGGNAQAQAANLSKGGHLSYVYVGKGMNMDTNINPRTMGDVVVAYEPMTNHNNDGSNFLFADGHVEFFGKGQAAQIITDVQAGTNPPRAKASPGY